MKRLWQVAPLLKNKPLSKTLYLSSTFLLMSHMHQAYADPLIGCSSNAGAIVCTMSFPGLTTPINPVLLNGGNILGWNGSANSIKLTNGASITATMMTTGGTIIGNGPGYNINNVTIDKGSSIDSTGTAISLGSNANINILGTVTGSRSMMYQGPMNMGPNIVEFSGNTTVNIGPQGRVIQPSNMDSYSNGEAFNPSGGGNKIINRGLIQTYNASDIWFEGTDNSTVSLPNTVENYGTITAGKGGGGQVLGASGQAQVNFTNYKGAVVNGNITLSPGASNTVTLYNGSKITGAADGGGDSSSLMLTGDGKDTLESSITGFGSLTKNGSGVWILNSPASNLSSKLNIAVNSGTLVSSGPSILNADKTTINNGGTLQIGNGNTGGGLTGSTLTDNGTLAVNRSDNVTLGQAISGTGGLNQNGSGTTILTGNSSYSGPTTIASGTLQLGNGGNSGSIQSSSITDNGTLAVNRSDNVTLGQAISGTGGLNQNGSGTTTLTGDSSYSGPTTIASGTLQLGNGGNSGSIQGQAITDNGTLAVNRSDNVTLGQAISGTGGLNQNGLGTTTLTGDSSYSGPTTIANGTLQLGNGGNSGSIQGQAITDNGTLAVNRSDNVTLGQAISGTGGLNQNGSGTTILTGNSSYSGPTTIASGTLQLGNGGNSGSIQSSSITDNGTLAVNRSDNVTLGQAISGTGGLNQNGSGTTTLTGDSSYSGPTTIASGTLQLGNGGNSGSIQGQAITDNGTLAVNRSDNVTLGQAISGTGGLNQNGPGTTTLTGGSSYSGLTTIAKGTLQLGNGGNSGSIQGQAITDNGTLAVNRSDNVTLGQAISGTGGLNQNGPGTTILTGANSYNGTTAVNAGTLQIDGQQGEAKGPTSVASQAALAGSGVVGGSVTVNDGGTLSPGDGVRKAGTLSIKGDLNLAKGSIQNWDMGQAYHEGGAHNDLVHVGGNLNLSGILNVSTSTGGSDVKNGALDAGVYRVYTYDGQLTGQSDERLGKVEQPSGVSVGIQTSVDHQVNLLIQNQNGLNLWNGSAGGSGVWSGSDNSNNEPPSKAMTVFEGKGGDVTVKDHDSAGNPTPVTTGGMQFANNDGRPYTVSGDPIYVSQGNTIIRVGDGTAEGAGITAVVNSPIDDSRVPGGTSLTKTDAGKLILGGDNHYQGDTTISDGTLQLGNGGTTGSIQGKNINNDGTLAVNRSDDVTLGQHISGKGGLNQDGPGKTTLTNDNTYQGDTNINHGTLQLGDGGTTGSIQGKNINNNGTLTVNRSDDVTLGQHISGTGGLNQDGPGKTTLTNDNTYQGDTNINHGTLQLGDGGTTGSIQSKNISNNGNLSINRSDDVKLDQNITGGGSVSQDGSGRTTIAKDMGYTGDTNITHGTLQIGDGGTTGSVQSKNINNDGTLAINRSDTHKMDQNISGKGGLSQEGSGTTVLTHDNTYQGDTAIKNGTLQLGDGGTTGSIQGKNINNDGTLAVNRSDDVTLGQHISGKGGLNQDGPGKTTLTNDNTYQGDTNINHGTLQLGDGGTTGSIQGKNINNNGTLTVNRSDDVTLGQHISGTGGLNQDGPGKTTLTNDNTYQGDTNINHGTLQLGDGGTTGSIQSKNISNNGNLSINRSDDVKLDQNITGGGSVSQDGSGRTTIAKDMGYTGDTNITHGTLQIGDGGTTGSVQSKNINNDGTLAINRSDTHKMDQNISGKGGLSQEGSGTTVLTHDNTYQGDTAIKNGTLQLGDGGTTGSIQGKNINNDGTLAVNRSDDVTLGQHISGKGGLNQDGPGKTTLTNDNTYQGDTNINHGTLQLGDGGTTGSIQGKNINNNGTLTVNRSDDVTLGQHISGTGGLNQDGPGKTVLSNNNSYAGPTAVNAGTLQVDGDQSGSHGPTTVASGATLAGSGTIGGDVHVRDGGNFSPGSGLDKAGTMNVNGNLAFDPNAHQDWNMGQTNAEGGQYNDFAHVKGDLQLGGTVNISTARGGPDVQGDGSLGGGVYRMYSYGGTLSGQDNLKGVMSNGVMDPNLAIQTSINHQINLVSGNGTLSFWDGSDVSQHGANNIDGNNKVDGGDGVWTAINGSGDQNWTNANGSRNAPWAAGSMAIFQGNAGHVTVKGQNLSGKEAPVTFKGMQFANLDGKRYVISGDALHAATGNTTIRVGDGTSEGAGITAEVDSVIDDHNLAGGTSLTKTDAGTLVLGGDNTYQGNTTINGGTLQLGNGGTTGSIQSKHIIDNGVLSFNRQDDVAYGQTISGSGSLSQDGQGRSIITSDATNQGDTFINHGTLQLGNGGTTGSVQGKNIINNATLAVNHSNDVALNQTISGTGAFHQDGNGKTTLTADNSYQGDTVINHGALQLGNGGTTGSVQSKNIIDNGTLSVNRSDDVTLTQKISGSGAFHQDGPGKTTLLTDNTYQGDTTINHGTLQLGDGGETGAIQSKKIVNNGQFIIDHSDDVKFDHNISGTGSFIQAGSGKTILSADNTYSGDTIVEPGSSLEIGNGATSGSISASNLINDGTLYINRSDSVLMAQTISGSGSIIANGQGHMTMMTTNNTYTGDFHLMTGTIVGSPRSFGTGAVIDDSTLIMNEGGVMKDELRGHGTFVVDGADPLHLPSNRDDSGFTGQVKVNRGLMRVDGNFRNAKMDVAQGATLTGGGHVGRTHIGQGGTVAAAPVDKSDDVPAAQPRLATQSLMVAPRSLAFSPAVSLMASPRSLMAEPQSLMMRSLFAEEDVETPSISADTQDPSSPLGTLTVSDNLTMEHNSHLSAQGSGDPTGNVMDVNGKSYQQLQSSIIKVLGTATLKGGNVDFTVPNGLKITPQQGYTLLTATQGVTGQYDALKTNLQSTSAFMSPALAYTANDVDVIMKANGTTFASIAHNSQQAMIGNALQQLPDHNKLLEEMQGMDAESARRAMPSLVGDIHASVRTALIQDSYYVRQAALDRLDSADCDGTPANGMGVADLKTGRKTDACLSNRPVLWGQAYGSIGHNGAGGSESSMHHSTAGFVMGADAPILATWRVGGLVSYGHSMFNLNGEPRTSGHSDNVTVGGYAGNHWGNLHLRMGAAYTWNIISTRRSVTAGAYNDRLNSNYLGGTAQAFAELGYKLHTHRSVIEPFANVAYVNLHTNSYREHGGDAALRGKGTDTGVTFSTFGVRASTSFMWGQTRIVPQAMVAYRHTFGLRTPSVREMFAGASNGTMEATGVPLSSNSAVLKLGMTAKLTNRIDVGVSYIGQYGNHSVDSGAEGHVKLSF